MILVYACKGTVFSARIIKLIYEICDRIGMVCHFCRKMYHGMPFTKHLLLQRYGKDSLKIVKKQY